MKKAVTHLFKRQSKNRAFSKLSNFYFDLRPSPPGKTSSKTEEPKPNPRDNWNVRIPGGRPGGDGQAWK